MKTEYKSKTTTINLTPGMFDDLKTVSAITGETITDILVESASREIDKYRNSGGRVKPINANRLVGTTGYEKALAKSEGRTPEIKRLPCYVLDETTMFGEPYYLIYDCTNKNLMKVPKDVIELVVGGVI